MIERIGEEEHIVNLKSIVVFVVDKESVQIGVSQIVLQGCGLPTELFCFFVQFSLIRDSAEILADLLLYHREVD